MKIVTRFTRGKRKGEIVELTITPPGRLVIHNGLTETMIQSSPSDTGTPLCVLGPGGDFTTIISPNDIKARKRGVK